MTTQYQIRRRFRHYSNQFRARRSLLLHQRRGGMFAVTTANGRLVWRGKGWDRLVAFAKQADIPGPHGTNGGCQCCR